MCSSSMSSGKPWPWFGVAAALTRMSTPPSSSTTRATIAATDSSEPVSAGTAITPGSRTAVAGEFAPGITALSACAASSSAVAPRATSATRAPSEASARPTASPIPRLPPVTIARRPFSSRFMPAPGCRSALGHARRVAAVQHQRVAVGIVEERHVAHAGVEDVAVELDAAALELRARGGHVLDVQREVVGVRLELADAHLLRVHDAQCDRAGLELREVAVGAVDRARQAQGLPIELGGSFEVLRGHGDEVDAGDDRGHAATLRGRGGYGRGR